MKRLATLALVLASPTGCGVGCGAELSVDPVTVNGHGQSTVDLSLAARLTDDGNPVVGAEIEFYAEGPNGVLLGAARTGPDGIAHLQAERALGPDSINGREGPTWTSYAARVAFLQQTDEAADAICAGRASAPFRFTP